MSGAGLGTSLHIIVSPSDNRERVDSILPVTQKGSLKSEELINLQRSEFRLRTQRVLPFTLCYSLSHLSVYSFEHVRQEPFFAFFKEVTFEIKKRRNKGSL